MSGTRWIGLFAVIIVGAGLVWWWSSLQSAPPSSAEQGGASSAVQDAGGQSVASNTADLGANSGTAVANTSAGTGVPTRASVTYDGNSFSPSTVAVGKGGTVNFTDTVGSMWVASSQHPSHTGYDSTSRSTHCAAAYSGPAPFDQCGPGSSYSFTFNQAGSWDYHDHMNAGAGGTVVVQ